MRLDEFLTVQRQSSHILGKELFFVSGAAKSGTTWLQKALDAHPDIACGGEGHFVNGIANVLKQAVVAYNSQLLERSNKDVYAGKGYYTPVSGIDLNYLITAFATMMLSKTPNVHKAIFVGDKTPANALHFKELQLLFPEAKYIHILRDGRDVVVSTYKMALRVNKAATIESYVRYAAPRWTEFNQTALDFQAKFPQLIHMVAYESLLEDFSGEFEKILRFLGANASATAVEACGKASSFETLTHGRKQGEEDQNSFFRKGISGDWKNHFSDTDLSLFHELTGGMLEKLGYQEEAAERA